MSNARNKRREIRCAVGVPKCASVMCLPRENRPRTGGSARYCDCSVDTPRSSDRLTTARVGRRVCRQPRCLDSSRPEALRPRLATGLLRCGRIFAENEAPYCVRFHAMQMVSTWRRADLATAECASGASCACSCGDADPRWGLQSFRNKFTCTCTIPYSEQKSSRTEDLCRSPFLYSRSGGFLCPRGLPRLTGPLRSQL
jgi:hypothetical protein